MSAVAEERPIDGDVTASSRPEVRIPRPRAGMPLQGSRRDRRRSTSTTRGRFGAARDRTPCWRALSRGRLARGCGRRASVGGDACPLCHRRPVVGGRRPHDFPIGYVLVDVVDGCAHVEQVSVLPNHQGAGVSRELLRRVRAWAADSGLSAIRSRRSRTFRRMLLFIGISASEPSATTSLVRSFAQSEIRRRPTVSTPRSESACDRSSPTEETVLPTGVRRGTAALQRGHHCPLASCSLRPIDGAGGARGPGRTERPNVGVESRSGRTERRVASGRRTTPRSVRRCPALPGAR